MIREVKREDIPSCVDLIRRSFMTVAETFGFTEENAPRFTAFAISEDGLYRQFDREKRPMFIAEVDGMPCGYYSLLNQGNGECELNNLAVLPEYRHRGLGKQLLEHSFVIAQQMGCHYMNIGIVEDNAVLRKWYEQNGAVHLGTRKYAFFPFTCGYLKRDL